MDFNTGSDPACNGKCKLGHTRGFVAINSINSSDTSTDSIEPKRMRSKPSMVNNSRTTRPKVGRSGSSIP